MLNTTVFRHSRASHLPLLRGLALLLCLASVSAPLRAFEISVQNNLVSILANGDSIAELANVLADRTGVPITLTGTPSSPVSAEIIDEPLDKAIARLWPNHMLVRANADQDSPILEVVLLIDDASSGSTGGEFLPSGAPATEIVPDDQLAKSPAPNTVEGAQAVSVPTGTEAAAQSSAAGDGSAVDAYGNAIRTPSQ